jgi:AcrR family transcriptional regulator
VPSRRKRPLDRARIVHAALALIDRDGLQGLTMRRLGRELGVEAMALYHYFKDKDDLLDACIEQVAASMDLSGMLGPGPWRERLRAGFRAYRELAHTHPQLFALVGHRAVRRVETLRPIELALAALADAGLTPAQSVRAFRIANSFVYGYALSELTGLAMQTALQTAPPADPGQFPHLTAALPIARDTDRDAEFEHGLDLILSAIVSSRSRAPARAASRSSRRHRPPRDAR